LNSFLTRVFPELIRLRITLSVTFSAFVAFILVQRTISINSLVPISGIFLLACGASALNQVQERVQDGKMNRTKKRPLPSGALTPGIALLISIFFICSGEVILFTGSYFSCALLGVLNIAWYNGIYTWLKKKTAFAVIPGALSGVIPVFMGAAAAGNILSIQVLFAAIFLFMWQIPHFWLLMLKYEGEYRAAGFPVMTDIFEPQQFRNIIFSWMIGATGTSLILVLSGFQGLYFPGFGIMGLNIFLLAFSFRQFYFSTRPKYTLIFMFMNIFLLIVLSLLAIEKLLI
jgi:heme o synthase